MRMTSYRGLVYIMSINNIALNKTCIHKEDELLRLLMRIITEVLIFD